jgi:hypothetical protein
LNALIFNARSEHQPSAISNQIAALMLNGEKDSLLHQSEIVAVIYRITDHRLLIAVLGRPGGHSEEPIPDPIPNSAVKVLCADGTKPQGLEE